MVWGANPSATAPHVDQYWLGGSEALTIVVDPVAHDTARRADIHLMPRPGSDALLAFALMRACRDNGDFDRQFIDTHTVGFEELERAIDALPLARAARETGVDAGLIREAAQAFGAGPSLLWLGQGLQRQPRGGNIVRAAALLPVVTGNLLRPGAGVYYLNGAATRGIDAAPVESVAGARAYESISHMELADRLADAGRTAVFVCWNMNPAASSPDQSAMLRALAAEHLFTVVIDPFMTDTARFADVVLPSATFLEADDLLVPYFHKTLSAVARAVDPPGQARANSGIFRALSLAMGYDDPELLESDESVIARVLEDSGIGLTFDQLKAAGTVVLSGRPIGQFNGGRFRTPSGRIEIVSPRAGRDGHPRLPLAEADPLPATGRLRLLSPAGPWQMNSSYGNDAAVRRQLGELEIHLNAGDAAAAGLADGGHTDVVNNRARLRARVVISDRIGRQTALIHKGRWPGLEPSGHNVNALTGNGCADMGRSTAVHGTEVWLEAPKG